MKKYIVLLFLGVTITVHAQVIKLKVPEFIQEQTQWCWAAASNCILYCYNSTVQQCMIAEYVRLNGTVHDYGTTPCCKDPLQGCNQGTSFTGGTGSGSIQDILEHFGQIKNYATGIPLEMFGIEHHLGRGCPILMRWTSLSDTTHHHAMVVYGMQGDVISFMDPDCGYDYLPYYQLRANEAFQWTRSITLAIPPKCRNCTKDPDEEEMDCGGICPPCEHAPAEKSFTTSTNNLPSQVYALEKITAGDASVQVILGQDVTFNTLGEIVLLPGFEVEEGSNFTTNIKGDIFEVTADCNPICSTAYYPSPLIRYKDYFHAVDLINVDKVYYEITNIQTGRPVHNDMVYVTKEGIVNLWNLKTGESSSPTTITQYIAQIRYYLCNGKTSESTHKFTVKTLSKSLTEESDDIEKFASSPSQNIENMVSVTENEAHHFSIIPNPNPGAFQIETNFSLSDIANFKIINLMGATVYETQQLSTNTIQLANSPAGHYFVVMILKDGTVLTQKMMVQ